MWTILKSFSISKTPLKIHDTFSAIQVTCGSDCLIREAEWSTWVAIRVSCKGLNSGHTWWAEFSWVSICTLPDCNCWTLAYISRSSRGHLREGICMVPEEGAAWLLWVLIGGEVSGWKDEEGMLAVAWIGGRESPGGPPKIRCALFQASTILAFNDSSDACSSPRAPFRTALCSGSISTTQLI